MESVSPVCYNILFFQTKIEVSVTKITKIVYLNSIDSSQFTFAFQCWRTLSLALCIFSPANIYCSLKDCDTVLELNEPALQTLCFA